MKRIAGERRIDRIRLDHFRPVPACTCDSRLQQLLGDAAAAKLAAEEEAGKGPHRSGVVGEVIGAAKAPVGRAGSNRAPGNGLTLAIAGMPTGTPCLARERSAALRLLPSVGWPLPALPPDHAPAALGAPARLEEAHHGLPASRRPRETRGAACFPGLPWALAHSLWVGADDPGFSSARRPLPARADGGRCRRRPCRSW